MAPIPSRSPLAAFVVSALVGLASCSGGSSAVGTDAVPTTVDIAQNPEGGSFRLLTYNVGGLPVEVSEGRPDVNIPLISPLLDEYDLVLTQEDYDWWAPEGAAAALDFVNYHGRLRAQADHEHQSPVHPGPESVGVERDLELGDGLGILSRLPVAGDARVPWEGCFGSYSQDDGGKGDCLAMKGFQVTTLTLANGAEVLVYNVNAEAGTNRRDQELQVAGYDQLAADIVERAKGRAVIVGAHTNLHLDDAHPASGGGEDRRTWERFLAATGLRDACEAGSCDDANLLERVVYRSSADVALEATTHRLRSDRFVDDAGGPLSEFPPLEVSFSWRAA